VLTAGGADLAQIGRSPGALQDGLDVAWARMLEMRFGNEIRKRTEKIMTAQGVTRLLTKRAR
jgi:hypothetical protein